MKLDEAIGIIKGLIKTVEISYKSSPLLDKPPYPAVEALTLAISALEKQEQDNNKSCDTCKHKNLRVSEFPCDECYFASYLEDHYEPYTEEET